MSIGSPLFFEESVSCSMTWMKERVHALPSGAVLVARNIRHARGRGGRAWQVWPGQLLITILLKPSIVHRVDRAMAGINMFSGVACVDGLAPYAPLALKWPNDVVHEGKKVGGVVLESVWRGRTLEAVVCGVGLNINVPTTAFTLSGVTSIYEIARRKHDLEVVLHTVLEAFDHQYILWSHGEYQKIYEVWRLYQAYCGRKFTVHTPRGTIHQYVMDDVLPSGDVLVHTSDDPRQRVIRYSDVL